MTSLPFQPLLDWVGQNPNLSGVVVFGIAAAESLVVVGILVPGVAMMLGIGTLVGLDVLPLWPTLFWAAAGAMVGDGLGYWVGHHYDTQLRHIWPMTRYPELIPKGEHFFQRHGVVSILFGRFVGPVRSIIPAVAGMMHMPPARFYLVNILSGMAWAPAVILPGVAVGASLNLASEVALRFAEVLVAAILLLWSVGWVLHRLFGRIIVKVVLRAHLIFNTLLRFYPRKLIASTLITALVFIAIIGATLWRASAPFPPYSLTQQQWWGKGWQTLPVYRNGNVRQPLQLQWQGMLDEIHASLLASGWKDAQTLNMKNAMRWLSPHPHLAQLPVQRQSLGNQDEALIMFHNDPRSGELLVMRLWRVGKVVTAGEKHSIQHPLWIGSVRYRRVIEIGAKFFMPDEFAIGRKELVALSKNILTHAPAVELKRVRQKTYPDVGLWRGEVLLVRDKKLEAGI